MAIIELSQSSQKEKIADNFSQGVQRYLTHSPVQKQCANQLLKILDNRREEIPTGSILEIGCGTEFVTQGLIQCFPRRFLEIIDISPEMLTYCQNSLVISPEQRDLIKFRQKDGEKIDPMRHSYAAIISNFTVQWFQDLTNSINRLLNTLHPQGILFIAFPNDQSFPEWKNACEALNLPFTRNQLPNTIQLIQQLPIGTLETRFYEDKIKLNYDNAKAFFRSLKVIGAGLNLENQRLSLPQMKQLINYWNQTNASGKLEVTYSVTFLVMRRNQA